MALKAKASSSSSSYDVFLNFSGEDTGKTFTGHLYLALMRERIRVYIDSYKLWEGEEIGSTLSSAIQKSTISIPIFSKSYADSEWCLMELVKILECYKSNNQVVLPIFLDVDRRDVQNQTGSFGKAFNKHARKYGRPVVKTWRDALTEIRNLKGWVLSDIEQMNESNLVELVVERALTETTNTPFMDTRYRIGLDFRVNDLQFLLNSRNKDVQYIGICGIGGIGKTTIVEAFSNCVSKNFHQSIFLANVREEARLGGLVSLQKKLILRFSRQINDDILSVDHGKQIIKRRLDGENALLILDDVDCHSQLNAFALDLNWLGQGSTVIITTTDENILKMTNVDKEKIYWPMELDDGHSLRLFSLCAFQQNIPLEDYMELSCDVVRYSGGLPLTLEVLGSYLSDVRNKKVWECTIQQLRECAPKEVHERLRISYDNLENDYQKTIFLDSACFFVGWEKETVTSIWEACGFHYKSAIARLIERSLLRFEYDETGSCRLRMHDQIQYMGKEIASKEYLKEPGKRSRLCSHDDFFEVLEKKKVIGEIEGIFIPSGLPITLTSEHFENMHKLRLLNVNQIIFIPSGLPITLTSEHFENMHKLRLLNVNQILPKTKKKVDPRSSFSDFWRLPSALRWFKWKACSWDILPTKFYHKELIHLDLSFSMIKQTWITSPEEGNKFHNLKVLNLRHCENLWKFPSFRWFPCLEKLDLGYCRKLWMLDESIGELSQLKSLNLEYCDSLEELPVTIGNLGALVKLKLRVVTRIMELPNGVGLLEKLEELDAHKCKSLVSLPDLSRMKNLRRLYVSCCNKLQQIRGIEGLKSLDILDATASHLLTLPCKKIIGQGSLRKKQEEYNYSLTTDGASCGLVMCIVFEGLQVQQSLREHCFDISVSIRKNDKVARFHHTLLIDNDFYQRKGENREIIYLYYFKGFDWFGIPLEGKDAIENLVIRKSSHDFIQEGGEISSHDMPKLLFEALVQES